MKNVILLLSSHETRHSWSVEINISAISLESYIPNLKRRYQDKPVTNSRSLNTKIISEECYGNNKKYQHDNTNQIKQK